MDLEGVQVHCFLKEMRRHKMILKYDYININNHNFDLLPTQMFMALNMYKL